MSESFVDLSYRGLALGKRIKLTQVRPGSGYLEIPTPMPVGTLIAITTDDGLQLDAMVAEVHEQVGGSDRIPGMVVKPKLEAAAAGAWWKARASGQDERPERHAPAADDAGVVTVKSPRMTGELAVPELVDDGRDTGVMEVPPTDVAVDTEIAEVPLVVPPRSTNPGMAVAAAGGEEAASTTTTMMDAVDLAALGLSTGSGEMKAVKAEDFADDEGGDDKGSGEDEANDDKANGNGGGDKPDATGGGKKKKRRKRR